jgi:hypothetical protein
MDDGKSLRTANKGQLEEAIKNKHRRFIASEEDPWIKNKKGSKDTNNGKATHVNRIRLANVICMKEACSSRGAPLKKEDLIISTDGSKGIR